MKSYQTSLCCSGASTLFRHLNIKLQITFYFEYKSIFILFAESNLMVALEGVEPTHLSIHDPKSCASTNFAIEPFIKYYIHLKHPKPYHTLRVTGLFVMRWNPKSLSLRISDSTKGFAFPPLSRSTLSGLA